MATTAYEGWAIVELFGHVKLAGRVSEADQFGTKMLRLDVPAIGDAPSFTTFKGGSALYAVTPCTEEVAVALLGRLRPEPIQRYELKLPHRLEAPIEAETVDHDDSEPGDGDQGPGF